MNVKAKDKNNSNIPKLIISFTITNVSVKGGSDGKILLNVSSTNPPYSLDWTGPSSGTISNLTDATYTILDLKSGIYNISVTDGDEVINIKKIIITDPESPPNDIHEPPEEIPQLKSAMGVITAINTGNWNNTSTWDSGTIPTASDNVIIPNGFTVTVAAAAEARDITIQSGGGLNISGSNTLKTYGSWANSGNFDAGTSGVVEFAGNTNSTITGTTNFEDIVINKGSDSNTIVEINGSVSTSTGGNLTLTNGLIQINGGASFTCNHNHKLIIPDSGGILVNGGTLTSSNFSIQNDGLFQIDSGTANLGSESGNSIITRSSGTFTINSGTISIAGRFQVSGGTANIHGGTINLNTVGHNSSLTATLDLSSASDFTMTGGTIVFLQSNGSGNLDISILNGAEGSKTISGGEIQFGGASTPYGTNFKIHSVADFYNLSIHSGKNITVIPESDISISNHLSLNDGKIDSATNSITTIITNAATDAITSSSGYIIGDLQRAILNAGSLTYLFPVGNNGNYTPLELTFNGLTLGGNVTVSSVGGDHPNLNSSILNSANSVNNYWNVTNSGVAFTSVNGTFTFPAGLGDGETYKVGMYNGAWTYPDATSSSPASVSFSGVTNINNVSFALAECIAPSFTIGSNPTICYGTTTVGLPYTITSETANEFRIDFGALAEAQGISDIPWTVIPASPIALTLPATAVANTYSATLSIRNAIDCESIEVAFSIVINPQLPVSVSIVTDNNTVCDGTSVNFVATPVNEGATPSYQWKVNGINQGANYPNFNYAPANGDVVTVVLTSSETCASGNPATSNTEKITVYTSPSIATCPTPLNLNTTAGDCAASGTYTVEAAGDPVPDFTYVFTGATAGSGNGTGSGELFNAGVTSVAVTATNTCGSADCIFTITVEDNIPPVIADCPPDITVYTGPGRPGCDLEATWTEPTATDNCTPVAGLTWAITHPSGSSFPVGTTTVTYTVEDASENETNCSFNVTVIDNTKPTFTVPGDVTINSDASCNSNRLPALTGSPISQSDNCTVAAAIVTSYSDGASIPGACAGSYRFIRTWTVEDEAGNQALQTQTITVIDNIAPVLDLPDDAAIECSASYHPDNTGWATATDNCGGIVTFTYTDTKTDGSCTNNYTYTRTWTATDDCGNFMTGTQNIDISDTEAPIVISVTDITVACPENIPDPDPAGINATDNCGSATITFVDQISYGLEGQPGYCPTSLSRIWRITDDCGNYTDTSQTITINDPCDCARCNTENSFYWIDMLGDPDGVVTLKNLKRLDYCCDYSGNKPNCISFNIRLDEDAVGVEISIAGATPSSHEWKMDCNTVEMDDGIICAPGGEFHLFTFCKPGSNANDYTFRSIQGVVASDDIHARVDCMGQLEAEGIISNPVWNSISPGNIGDYNHYLSSTTVSNPIFTPLEGAPSVIIYQICGNIGSIYCTEAGIACDTISVYTKDAIAIELNINPDVVCEGIIPTLSPTITPAGTYSLEWFTVPDAAGTPAHTGLSYTPSTEGAYSVRITDMQEGIPCSELVYNFDITFDHAGPTVNEPPLPLEVQCNSTHASQQIIDWLNSASASYIAADSTLVEFVPDNNYTGIDMVCGEQHTVTFTAEDQCSNISTASSTITIIDTIPPAITCPADADTIADDNLCLINNFLPGIPTITDDCDFSSSLSWEKSGATTGSGTGAVSGPFNVGITTVTYVAEDACNNTDTCTQLVTIYDNQPPTITCPPDVFATAPPPDCVNEDVTIAPPVLSDNCPTELVTLTWEKTGATVGAGSGDVSHTDFNVGVTTVIYTVTDDARNTDSCSFNVTINDRIPPTITECPNDITVYVPIDSCETTFEVPSPVGVDPCGEIFSVRHDSPYAINDSTASGTYPVGVHTITWTITDISENASTCEQMITVLDTITPTLSCPADFSIPGDWQQDYASNVNISPPIHNDNCNYVLFWGMHGATSDTSLVFDGIDYITSPYPKLDVGENMITYYLADNNGDTITCLFTITVEAEPEIECPPDTLINTQPDSCTVTFNPGIPNLIQGDSPIDWTWEISGATTGFGSTNGATPLPDPIGDYTFNLGETTIRWAAKNSSGTDTCYQTIVVIDEQLPIINPQLPVEECVEHVFEAVYYSPSPDITADRPEYFRFEQGNTILDINPADFSDNCLLSCQYELRWRIDFEDGSALPGTNPESYISGQPSTYGNDIQFPGDGETFEDVVHTIEYWLVDCNGNESIHITNSITIKPRPKIIKN